MRDTAITRDSGPRRSLRKQRGRFGETLAVSAAVVCTLVTTVPVVLFVIILLSRGGPAIDWEFLSQGPKQNMTAGGIFPAILGTLYLVAGTVAIAMPLGILAAVYLAEYARQGPLLRAVRLAIVNLAGVPSIVYGLFGYGVFVLLMNMGASIIAGSLTLAMLVLPLVITATEEALKTIPVSFREASLALGATRFQTIWRVILPGALPGILTGAILSIGRAAGETAPILFTAAVFYQRKLPDSIYSKVMALPYHLYIMSTQVPNAPEHIKWGTALVLLLVVLAASLGAILLRSRLRRKRNW